MAASVAALLADSERRRKLGAEARAFVLEHFSPEAHVRRLEGVYAGLLAGQSEQRQGRWQRRRCGRIGRKPEVPEQMSYPEAERNRLLRRVDWRFLLADPQPKQVSLFCRRVDGRGAAPGQRRGGGSGSQCPRDRRTKVRLEVPGTWRHDASFDLAVVANPSPAELRAAWHGPASRRCAVWRVAPAAGDPGAGNTRTGSRQGSRHRHATGRQAHRSARRREHGCRSPRRVRCATTPGAGARSRGAARQARLQVEGLALQVARRHGRGDAAVCGGV